MLPCIVNLQVCTRKRLSMENFPQLIGPQNSLSMELFKRSVLRGHILRSTDIKFLTSKKINVFIFSQTGQMGVFSKSINDFFKVYLFFNLVRE